MKFCLDVGRFGPYRLGEVLPDEPQFRLTESFHGLYRVPLATGGFAILRADRTIDAIGVEEGYPNTITGGLRIGDPVRLLFRSDLQTPVFGGDFIEVSDFVMYFIVGEIGVSVHPRQHEVEDGPFCEADWLTLLEIPISQVWVAKHSDKMLAY